MLRINVGCGDIILPDYINVDLFITDPRVIKADVKDLPFKDNIADEVFSSHVIEHFTFIEAFSVLKEWRRVLKIGGRLVLEAPDFEGLCRRWLAYSEQDRPKLYMHTFGDPWRPGRMHMFNYTSAQMEKILQQTGFDRIKKIPQTRFPGGDDINLCFEAYKTDKAIEDINPISYFVETNTQTTKVFVLHNGIGDHYCFKTIWHILKERFKYHELVISCSYPEVFDDLTGVKVIPITIADTKPYNIYGWMWKNNWINSGKNMADAYLELYR